MICSDMKVIFIDNLGNDLTVVNSARVSFFKNSNEINLSDIKLINYLAKHNHWTPFAHCYITYRIKAPIFVARQLMRSTVGLTINEVSRRYVDYEPEFYIPDTFRSKPSGSIKQGSGNITINYDICKVMDIALETYNDMLRNNIAPEMARMVLPLNTMTEWIWTGSLYAFSRVYNLRIDKNAQKETKIIASLIGDDISKLYPISWKALTDNTLENNND